MPSYRPSISDPFAQDQSLVTFWTLEYDRPHARET